MGLLEGGEFAGQLALVTGAAQGIGAATARALALHGALVVALDRQAERLQQFAAQQQAAGLAIQPLVADLAAGEQLAATVEQIEQSWGPIEVLVNGAAVLHLGAVTELSRAAWEESFAVNSHGLFYLTQAVAQRMQGRRRGAIVTIGSNAAAVPRVGMAAYAAAKAAASHFTHCLGLELAEYGIRCNVVSPGSTDTPMQRQLWPDGEDASGVLHGSLESHRLGIPLRRIATPEEVAEAVLFLASERARHITLHDLRIDGGATLGA